MALALGDNVNQLQFVILLGIVLGVYWAVASNLTVEATQDLTEGSGFAIGHQQMFGVWLVDKLAPKFSGKTTRRLKILNYQVSYQSSKIQSLLHQS